MIKILLLIIYLTSGQEVVTERSIYTDVESCQADGVKRIAELVKDPRFSEALLAVCVPVKADEI